MALDFPDSPTAGQIFKGFIYRNGAWRKAPIATALPKNYALNPAMNISQQNGEALSSSLATGSFYPADMWFANWRGSVGAMRAASWPNAILQGAHSCYLEAVTPWAMLGTHMALITQPIEGVRVADLGWGTPQAKDVVVRFLAASTAVFGTFSVRLSNSGNTRSYVAQFSLPDANWRWITLTIPGDTSGTWLTDNGVGIFLDFVGGVGTSYVGVAGWQDGNKYALGGQASASTKAGTFHISSVGLYADPYQTGVAPPWVMPLDASEHRACQRYWYKAFGLGGVVTAATMVARMCQRHPNVMRATPSGAIRGTPRIYDMSVTSTMSSLSSISNSMVAEFDVTIASAAVTGGRPGMNYYQDDAQFIEMNARLM